MSFFNQLVKIIKPSRDRSKDTKAVQKPVVKHEPQVVQVQKPAAPAPTSAQILAEERRIIETAKSEAREIVLEAKDESLRVKQTAEREIREKLEAIERKLDTFDQREKQLFKRQEEIEATREEITTRRDELLRKLEKAANLTKDEAKNLILKRVEQKLDEEKAKLIRQAEESAKEEAEKKAQEIIVDAMRFGATNYVAEYTVSTVKLPDEDVKGRIIGKEGRNIRTFEQVTGVDVDLDEEGVIRLSCFDGVRREIARVALQKLIADGRIQPARIEEVVEQTQKEIDKIMYKEGEKLCHSVGVFNLPRELIALLGRFKYRFSYGQNMIAHTLEETKIGIALAHEVKADTNIVRLGCLLHDIGKVVTDQEGTHVDLGVELLKKYGMPQRVIDCVAQHHEDTPFTSNESVLVYISDAISGARPGARYEDITEYVKRLQTLEEIATNHEGVAQAFAFQAGREVRVIVNPDKLDDAAITVLAQEIKEEVEKKLTFPGQIKVVAIREVRATAIAQ